MIVVHFAMMKVKKYNMYILLCMIGSHNWEWHGEKDVMWRQCIDCGKVLHTIIRKKTSDGLHRWIDLERD